jgi:hypothetical protein
MRVLARGYADRPLERDVVDISSGVIYLVNPSVDNSRREDGSGVGFPPRFVYVFDEPLFEGLTRAFKCGESSALERLWATAIPFH